MIVTSRFVFIHLHKSGGSFVNQFLLRFFPDARLIGYHLPLACMPVEYSRLPVFGLIRNPWDYYVSWYCFQSQKQEPNALFRCVSDNGRLDFCATVQNLLTLGESPALMARVLAELPEQFGGSGLNLTRSCMEAHAGSATGFYSFLCRRAYGDEHNLRIGRMEALRAEVEAFLLANGIALTQQMSEYLRHRGRANVSARTHYADYYDEKTRTEVARRDAYVIARFGYQFDMRHDPPAEL